ncbi:MAG TPA: hypothetical protein VMZ32_14795, partial [Gammaproteobacteria bacterium]|nr:hypothetical protein [Gammaproteobacteria bacterium]
MNAPLFVSSPRIRQPGLNVLPENTERYRIRAGGSVTLGLLAGDELELVSPEGLQPAEISVFDPAGRGDPGLIGLPANGNCEALQGILADKMGNTANLADALAALNISLQDARSSAVFRNHSPAGDSIRCSANEALTCIIVVPAEPMRADRQNTPT